MDAAAIQAQLTKNHLVFVERGGERFLVSEDEDCNGFFAWPTGNEALPAVASFGECDYDAGELTDPPDYRAVSEAVARWLAEVPHV